MNVLLKIVEGPNAGAQALLPEGVRIAVGRADDCDIILADDTLPAKACEIEVSSSGAAELFSYDGTDEELKFFRVKYLSQATAIAVGPEAGAWDELEYPAEGKVEEPSAGADAPAEPREPPPARSGRRRIAGALLGLLAPVFAAAMLLRANFVQEAPSDPMPLRHPDPRAELEEAARRYNLAVREESGRPVVFGVLATFEERVEAEACLRRAMRGARLEIGDDESVLGAAAEVLSLVGASGLSAESSKGGVLSLKGTVSGKVELMRILEAIRADVPHLKDVACAKVAVTGSFPKSAPVKAAGTVPAAKVAGIIARPHPCIILKDGTRLAEGSEVGGFSIERISAESVLVRSADGVVRWEP